MRRASLMAVVIVVVMMLLGATPKPVGDPPVAKLAVEREPALCTLLPDGKTLAIGCWGRGVLLWDMQGPQAKALVAPDRTSFAIRGLRVCSDGKLMAVGTSASEAVVYSLPTGKVAYTTRLCEGSAIAFSPDGTRLATGTPQSGIGLFAAATGMNLARLPVEGQVVRLAFSPDGEQLACLRMVPGKTLLDLISVRDGKVLKNLADQVRTDRAMEFSSDGQWLLLSEAERTRWWDVKEGKQAGAVDGCPCAAFSPDGKMLAAAMANGSLRIIDPATGKMLRHHLRARSKAPPVFTPDGQRVVLTDFAAVQVFDVQRMPAGE